MVSKIFGPELSSLEWFPQSTSKGGEAGFGSEIWKTQPPTPLGEWWCVWAVLETVLGAETFELYVTQNFLSIFDQRNLLKRNCHQLHENKRMCGKPNDTLLPSRLSLWLRERVGRREEVKRKARWKKRNKERCHSVFLNKIVKYIFHLSFISVFSLCHAFQIVMQTFSQVKKMRQKDWFLWAANSFNK